MPVATTIHELIANIENSIERNRRCGGRTKTYWQTLQDTLYFVVLRRQNEWVFEDYRIAINGDTEIANDAAKRAINILLDVYGPLEDGPQFDNIEQYFQELGERLIENQESCWREKHRRFWVHDVTNSDNLRNQPVNFSPRPRTPGVYESQYSESEAWCYCLRFEGESWRAVCPSTVLVRQRVYKFGWTSNVERRLRDINRHFPDATLAGWRVYRQYHCPSRAVANSIERSGLSTFFESRLRSSLSTEMVVCDDEVLNDYLNRNWVE